MSERYAEKERHPGNQEVFTIRARLPWQKQPRTRVMIETSMDEKLLKPAEIRKVIHEYGEPLAAEVRVYALEEIVAEKLRAILQHFEKLEVRGWSRSRARDYYDLWRILATYQDQMNLAGFTSFLREKCDVRNVRFKPSLGLRLRIARPRADEVWFGFRSVIVRR
ncbi:MAG TPA: nucleotidyl transferase AbiEii/AbiGii toxin family protein, partial [Burkholderiales bacterium]|nr:nucleotidyl transferase AbiEii/AbiGii toxin family protein [Burkholderiales bacterium]